MSEMAKPSIGGEPAPPARRTVVNRIHRGHVLGAAAVLVIPIALFVSKGVAPLFVAAAVFALLADVLRERRLPPIPMPVAAVFLFLVAWGVLSAWWSIAPGNTLRLSATLAATCLGGLVLVSIAMRLEATERRFLEDALIRGVAAGGLLLFIEALTPLVLTTALQKIFTGREFLIEPTYANALKPAATVMAIMLWPAAAAILRRGARAGAAAYLLAGGAVVVLSTGGSAILGFAVGVLAFLAALGLGSRVRAAFMAVAVAVVATMPVAAGLLPTTKEIARVAPHLPDSVFPRIFIWRAAAAFIAETPVLGKGLNTSRSLSSWDEKVSFTGQDGTERVSELIPLHPHNAVLQVWLELGMPGAIALGALLVMLIRAITASAAGPPVRAAAFGALFCAFVVANISYGIWQSWWQGTLWLTAAFVAASLAPDGAETDSRS